MDSDKLGAGNISDKEDKTMAIRTECTSETESWEGDLKICISDNSDDDCSNAESCAEEYVSFSQGDLIIDISDSHNDYSNAESSVKESVFSERIADPLPRCNNLDLKSTEKSKSHTLSLENKKESFRKNENGESVAELATLCNTVTNISDIRGKKGSILSFATNRESKSNDSSSTDLNVGCSELPIKSKRPCNVLPIETKTDIKQRPENEETRASLSCSNNVARSTISNAKKEKDSLLAFPSELKYQDRLKKRKLERKVENNILDDAVYTWYLEELYHDKVITRPVLCEKALELNTKVGGSSDFKASCDWLCNFEIRHGIKELPSKSKISNPDTCVANSFLSYLDELQLRRFFQDDVYFAVETTIKWLCMPQNSISNSLNEKNNQKPQRITVLLCANAGWSHSLPLLVIGKIAKEKFFKGTNCSPVIYSSQRHGLIDSEIFMDWYTKTFIPVVKSKRVRAGKRGKVLLLVHSDQVQLTENTLNAVDKNFKVKILAVDPVVVVTSADPIMKLKRIFKTNILRRLLSSTDNEEVKEYSQKLLLKKCYNILGHVWNILPKEKRKETSKQQMGVSEEQNAAVFKSEINIEEFLELFRRIPGYAHCSKEYALEWLLIDTIISGDQALNMSERVISSKPEELLQNYDTDDVDTGDKRCPTNTEALAAFETALKWCEQQQNCFPNDLASLKQLRDMAARKSSAAPKES